MDELEAFEWCFDENATVRFVDMPFNRRVRVSLGWWNAYYVERDSFTEAVEAAKEYAAMQRQAKKRLGDILRITDDVLLPADPQGE